MKPRTFQLSQIDMNEFSLAGYSVAGEETVIVAPELDACFDIGRCPYEALHVNHVLLSHGHADHSVGLIYYFHQRHFQGIGGGRALIPAELEEPIHRLIRAWGRVDGNAPEYELVPMQPGDDYEIRRGLIARAFATRHRNASLGFSIIDVRKKLRKEFHGLSGPEIVEKKKQGIEVTRTVEIPLVAYLGDTARANYSDLPEVARARALLVECTFFDPDHISRARAGKHLHVADLPELLEGMDNEKIIIVHVTRRTNLSQARRILRRSLPKDVQQRLTFLMSRKHVEAD
jgi:ribonuclease Z